MFVSNRNYKHYFDKTLANCEQMNYNRGITGRKEQYVMYRDVQRNVNQVVKQLDTTVKEAFTVTDPKDCKPGIPYNKCVETRRILYDKGREIPKEEQVESVRTYYTPKIGVAIGNQLYDPNRGWSLSDYLRLRHQQKQRISFEEATPRPLETEIERPRFPLEALPEPYRTYTINLAETMQVPMEMVGVSILAVLAGCLQGRYRVRARDKFEVPLCLYIQVVAEPGERKSPVFEEVVRPLKDIQAEMTRAFDAKWEDLEIELERCKGLKKKAEEDYVKHGDSEEGPAIKAEIKALNQRIRAIEAQAPPILYLDNATTEAMGMEVERNGGRMVVMSDEGDLISIISGVYTGGEKMIELVLKGHTGAAVRINRVGRKAIDIPSAHLTLLLMVQPVIVERIMRDETLRRRGLNARFLYTFPKSMVGDRNTAGAMAMDEGVERRYYEAVQTMFNRHVKPPESVPVLALTDAAQSRFLQYEASFEHRLKGDLAGLQDWGNKLGGEMLRLIGILHCAKHPGSEVATPIATATVNEAYHLACYFAEYARIIYSIGGVDINMQTSRKVLGFIKEHCMTSFTCYELFRKRRFGCKKSEEMETYLNILQDYGYLKKVYTEMQGREVERYEVHPSIIEGYQRGRARPPKRQPHASATQV